MKTRLAYRTRRVLMGAAGGVLLTPPVWLLTQSSAFSTPPTVDVQEVLRENVDREGDASDSAAADVRPAGAASRLRLAAYADGPLGRKAAGATHDAFETPVVRQAAGAVDETDEPAILLAQATRQPPQADRQASSDVLRELEKLYQEEGKQMPPMHPTRLPNTVHGPKTVGVTPEVGVRPADPEEKKNKGIRGFFRKLNPFARSKPKAEPQPQPRVAAPPRSDGRPQSLVYPHSRPAAKPQLAQPQSPPRPLAGDPAPPAPRHPETMPRELPLHVRNEAVENRAAQPVAGTVARRPHPLEAPFAPPPAPREAPPPPSEEPVAAVADDLGDPFSDVSESEADGQADPFSGLKLTDLPGAASEEEAGPSLTPPAPAEPKHDPRQRQIAEREGTGFKGFCPVALRDERELRDADSQYFSFAEGQLQRFSSAEAKAKFDANPAPYLPANKGHDPVLAQAGLEVEGTLEHSVWFHDRLHMFSSAETLAEFIAAIDLDAE